MSAYREAADKEPAEVRFKQVIYADTRVYGLTESGELYQGYWENSKIVEWHRVPMIIKEE